jgi:hypothetical protein
MPRRSPYEIRLSIDERFELERRAKSHSLEYWTVMRAKMILLAADGVPNNTIAGRLNTRREVVSRWRKRFFFKGLAGLESLVAGTRRDAPKGRRNL